MIKNEFETSDLVQTLKLMNPGINLDQSFTFYYDETNNIKKFYLKEDNFNYSFRSNFILGGVVHIGDKPDIKPLFAGLNLQSTVKEVKFHHIACGEFLDCLKSKKLNFFLKTVLNSPLYFHYGSLNLLYFSIVDIVDSAIISSGLADQLTTIIKNALYKVCKIEIDNVIRLFYKYKYPNISNKDILPFIDSLMDLFKPYESDFEFHLELTSLRQILDSSKINGSLPFIMNEEDHVLLKDFTSFYLRPMYTFRNSEHIFDKEETMESVINDYTLTDHGRPFTNHRFEDSKNELLIQTSDIFVGFAGKLSTFINSNTHDKIEVIICGLNELQRDNLDTYMDIINKSEAKNRAFFHNFDCHEELSKLQLIFEMRNKR